MLLLRNKLHGLMVPCIFYLHDGSALSYESKALSMILRQFSSASNNGVNTASTNSFEFSNYRKDNNPPDPIPNRPLRGPPQSQHSHQGNRPGFRERVRNDQSDDNFLEKFKLGFEKRKKPQGNPTSTQTLQEGSQKISDQMMNEQPPLPPEDADEIFKKMKATGLIPNAVAMLDGLCKDGLVQEAMKLFGLMREKGSIPEVVVYTAVVEGFCKAHRFDDAKRIFRKMQDKGICPNAYSYTVLVQGLYKCNKLEDALEFCEEMIDASHSPNMATFVGLVDGICKEKGVEEAKNAIHRLRQKGFFINEKAVREFLEKKAPFSPMVWEAILGKKPSQKLF